MDPRSERKKRIAESFLAVVETTAAVFGGSSKYKGIPDVNPGKEHEEELKKAAAERNRQEANATRERKKAEKRIDAEKAKRRKAKKHATMEAATPSTVPGEARPEDRLVAPAPVICSGPEIFLEEGDIGTLRRDLLDARLKLADEKYPFIRDLKFFPFRTEAERNAKIQAVRDARSMEEVNRVVCTLQLRRGK